MLEDMGIIDTVNYSSLHDDHFRHHIPQSEFPVIQWNENADREK
jgi:hypothetical protein